MTGPDDISPASLADLIRPRLDTALVAFAVDGVLAPLVDHADDAQLSPGVADGLAALAHRSTVAIVSGRALERLERLFGSPHDLHVIGSHGLEFSGGDRSALDDDERYTFEQLEIIGSRGVDAAGEGAWLEYKPVSVVLHTREADPQLATPAIEAVTNLARMIDGAEVEPGNDVVELLARATNKGEGEALVGLAARLDRSPVVFLGGDATDEDAFRWLTDRDISVRIGPEPSAARFRMDGPPEVAEFVARLG